MSQLLQVPVKIHGLWHAGNYDPNDFLGRLIKDKWVKTFELSLAQTIDYNWFASDDHLKMFRENFGYDNIECFRTGWPMEYLKTIFEPKEKENIMSKVKEGQTFYTNSGHAPMGLSLIHI